MRQLDDSTRVALRFSADGKYLLADGGVWNLSTNQKRVAVAVEGEPVTSADLSPDGKTLATSHADPLYRKAGDPVRFEPSVCLWDAATGKLLRRFQGVQNSFERVVFSPDGKVLAITSEEPAVLLRDATTGKTLGRLPGHHLPVRHVAFSHDGTMLAGADALGRVLLWDVRRRKELHPIERQEGFLCGVCYSPDGKILAAAGDNAIRLFEAATGKLLGRLEGHRGRVLALAWSADGKRLASGGDEADGTTRWWDVAGSKERRQFKDGGGCVALSPDGKYLASGRYPLRLRKAASGKEITAVDYDDVRCLAFAPAASAWRWAPGVPRKSMRCPAATRSATSASPSMIPRPAFLAWPTRQTGGPWPRSRPATASVFSRKRWTAASAAATPGRRPRAPSV